MAGKGDLIYSPSCKSWSLKLVTTISIIKVMTELMMEIHLAITLTNAEMNVPNQPPFFSLGLSTDIRLVMFSGFIWYSSYLLLIYYVVYLGPFRVGSIFFAGYFPSWLIQLPSASCLPWSLFQYLGWVWTVLLYHFCWSHSGWSHIKWCNSEWLVFLSLFSLYASIQIIIQMMSHTPL